MDGFNLYWKLMINSFQKNIFFVAIFICFLIFSTPFFSDSSQEDAKVQKVTVLCINHDENSALVNSMLEYLKSCCNFVNEKGSDRENDKVLFYRKADCVLEIPKNFTSSILAGEKPYLEERKMYDDVDITPLELAVSQYLKIIEMEREHSSNDLEQLLAAVENVLDQNTSFSIYADNITNKAFLVRYLNMLSFSLFCSVIMILGRVNIMLWQENIANRNLIAPISILEFKVKAALAFFLFSILFTSVFLIGGIFLAGVKVLDEAGILMILNTYIYALCITSFAYVAGRIVSSVCVLNPLTNICGVVFGFLSGAFIKQSELSSVILRFAALNPMYWFIRNNEELGKKTSISGADFKLFAVNAGILVGFLAVFLSISYIIGAKKIKMES